VTSVSKGLKGPQITVSRTHPARPQALRARGARDRLGTRRDHVARPRAGHRTKIAVVAKDPAINAKGACIGEMGRRVRAVTEELGGEKIDIVDYDPELAKFVANALSPAKVTSSFVLDANTKAVRALVPDYQLSLAIGKEGQNARLAAKLTGAKIDIQPDSISTPERGGRMEAVRTCVGCRARAPRSALLRVVSGTAARRRREGRPSGRGAWVHDTERAWRRPSAAAPSDEHCACPSDPGRADLSQPPAKRLNGYGHKVNGSK
jgi:transcription antitermination factor NusA-like protein